MELVSQSVSQIARSCL